MPPKNKSKARPRTKAKTKAKTKANKISRGDIKPDSESSDVSLNTPDTSSESEQKVNTISPTSDKNQVNPADVEEIGELINTDMEEEWDEDEEDEDTGDDDDYDPDNEEIDECVYDVTMAKKPGLTLADIDEDDDLVEDDDFDDKDNLETKDNHKKIIPLLERITSPMITKYEKVRLLCDRTTQLALGAKPMIRGVEQIKHHDREKMIAQLEFEARVIPIIIERERPDGAFEEWKLSELKYKDNMIVYGKDAFSDPAIFMVNPTYLKKRTTELQKGGNITGFSKVESAPRFDNNFLETLVANF
jgi:DNA-directed RNA polymerase I, II, and III subunit RPABC2